MFQKRTSPKRRLYNAIGLTLSTAYLALSFLLKTYATSQFEEALQGQKITYRQIDTRPSALNTVLWNANIDTQNHYLLGDYSLFDTQPIHFEVYAKNHELLGDLIENEKVKQMINISEGWFTIIEKEGNLYYNDLRFGLLNLEKGSQDFVFQYRIDVDDSGEVTFTEVEKNRGDAKELLKALWERVQGN
jgi:inner membrane protein